LKIRNWDYLKLLKKVKEIAAKDKFTSSLPDGLGITIFQKL